MNKQYSEEDIEKAIYFIKTNRSDLKPTREEAIKLLDTMENFAEVFAEIGEKQIKKNRKKKN